MEYADPRAKQTFETTGLSTAARERHAENDIQNCFRSSLVRLGYHHLYLCL